MNKTLSLLLIVPLLSFSCSQGTKVTIINEDENKGTVTPSGYYQPNTILILEAKPKDGYLFTGWYQGDLAVSFANPCLYYVPFKDVTVTAKWEDFSSQAFNFNLNEDNTFSISYYRGEEKKVIIPKTHYGVNVTKILDKTFIRNDTIEEIVIHDDIKSIGKWCFENVSLKKITMPANLKDVGSGAFSTWGADTEIKVYNSSLISGTGDIKRTKWGWTLTKNAEGEFFNCLDSESVNPLAKIYLLND